MFGDSNYHNVSHLAHLFGVDWFGHQHTHHCATAETFELSSPCVCKCVSSWRSRVPLPYLGVTGLLWGLILSITLNGISTKTNAQRAKCSHRRLSLDANVFHRHLARLAGTCWVQTSPARANQTADQYSLCDRQSEIKRAQARVEAEPLCNSEEITDKTGHRCCEVWDFSNHPPPPSFSFHLSAAARLGLPH